MVGLKEILRIIIPMYDYIEYIIDETDTRLFDPEALKMLEDPEKRKEIEKMFGLQKIKCYI